MLSYVDEGTGLMVAQALERWPAQRSRTCHALRGSAWAANPRPDPARSVGRRQPASVAHDFAALRSAATAELERR